MKYILSISFIFLIVLMYGTWKMISKLPQNDTLVDSFFATLFST